MRREDIDWTILRRALVILVISIALCSTLIVASFYFQKQMLLEYNRNNANFRSISSRYLSVDEEEKLIKNYLPKFTTLFHNGVIGPEQRLNWIEVLRKTGQEMKLPVLNYQIESQKAYMPEFSVDLGKYNIYHSRMILTMQLLHEGDLFNIIKVMNEKAKGIYRITSCQLSQMVKEIQDDPAHGNVSATCDLDWYTIKLQDGSDIDV